MNDQPDHALAAMIGRDKMCRLVCRRWKNLSDMSATPGEYHKMSPIIFYTHQIDWRDLSRKYKLSSLFINLFADKLDWVFISRFQILSECDIENLIHYTNWHVISMCQKLSEKFIEKHSHKVNWCVISMHQKLGEKFIAEHSDKVNWKNISQCQALSIEFIREWADHIVWYNLFKNTKLNKNDLEVFRHRLTPSDHHLLLATELLEKRIEDLQKIRKLKNGVLVELIPN